MGVLLLSCVGFIIIHFTMDFGDLLWIVYEYLSLILMKETRMRLMKHEALKAKWMVRWMGSWEREMWSRSVFAMSFFQVFCGLIVKSARLGVGGWVNSVLEMWGSKDWVEVPSRMLTKRFWVTSGFVGALGESSFVVVVSLGMLGVGWGRGLGGAGRGVGWRSEGWASLKARGTSRMGGGVAMVGGGEYCSGGWASLKARGTSRMGGGVAMVGGGECCSGGRASLRARGTSRMGGGLALVAFSDIFSEIVQS